MFIDKDSIIINNVSIGQYLLSAKYDFNKLWGNDTGRNLAGNWTGTLLGIFPKLELTFRRLSQSELEKLAPIFDSTYQTVKYYDPYKKATTAITTYSNDWSNNCTYMGINEGITVNFISTKRRS